MDASLLAVLHEQLDPLEDLTERISATIVDEPPLLVREGGMIRTGANAEVDRLRAVQSGGKDMLAKIEADEKEKTGIRNLRVGYNRVFGYFKTIGGDAFGQAERPDRFRCCAAR